MYIGGIVMIIGIILGYLGTVIIDLLALIGVAHIIIKYGFNDTWSGFITKIKGK